MSTRSTVHFHDSHTQEPSAIVYRHMDGSPEAMLPDLQEFFTDVERQTSDTRFDDPSMLATRWAVWLADKCAHTIKMVDGKFVCTKTSMLDFLSVRIVLKDPSDIEYRYHVWCGPRPQYRTSPKVTWEEA